MNGWLVPWAGGLTAKGHKRTFWGDRIVLSMVVVVTKVHSFVKTHKTVHIK